MDKPALSWTSKSERRPVAPGVLVEVPALSYHAPGQERGDRCLGNKLVFGDNLPALAALAPDYAGRVRCVFIDPPYNTGSAFAQYDDGLAHARWLGLMRDRLELLRVFLSEQGSLWISIDDHESHYLKVLCDEVFGRANFVANVVWQKKYTIANDARWLSDNHDHILVYARDKTQWRPNRLPRTEVMKARYRNPDRHPKGPWKATPLHAKSGSHGSRAFSFTFSNGVRAVHPDQPFDTPKPERLLHRIIHLATAPGDIVLDCFAGSGTTGAVAHKMGRRWVMVECGRHCESHIVPRLRMVIDGRDQGGMSPALAWKGGGGFDFYTLAAPGIS